MKLTSPGVPDCYQGNELWDFSLVDPDNRRPVDYERRRALLAELRSHPDAASACAAAFASLPDGRAKLYVLWRLLELRKEREALFRTAGYVAVRASGERSRHLIAFARRHEGAIVLTVVPRLIAGLGVKPGTLPCGAEVWGDTRIDLSFIGDGVMLRDVFTGREHRVTSSGLALADILDRVPVSVLVK